MALLLFLEHLLMDLPAQLAAVRVVDILVLIMQRLRAGLAVVAPAITPQLVLLGLEGKAILVVTVMLLVVVAVAVAQVAQVLTAAEMQHRERVVWVLNSHLDLQHFMLVAEGLTDF
jgi:hypothetical protein